MSKRKLIFRVSRALAVGGLVATSSVAMVNCSTNPAPSIPDDAGSNSDAGDAGTDFTGTVNPAPDFGDPDTGKDAGTPDASDMSEAADAAEDASSDADADAND